MTCASCVDALDHCHGTLVVHPDGMVECSELECADTEQLRHELIIECHTVDGGCGCVETSRADILLAS
ncbi:hypothetical protein [Amycolatopsis nigrescens]|uniref:hypothetical protein n=1 Tax=Amycolatopsis nigrescens TaxID=381445 RepID=UPI000369C12A|nr:hypothetical protein [Amycolatopsis nigrescens]